MIRPLPYLILQPPSKSCAPFNGWIHPTPLKSYVWVRVRKCACICVCVCVCGCACMHMAIKSENTFPVLYFGEVRKIYSVTFSWLRPLQTRSSRGLYCKAPVLNTTIMKLRTWFWIGECFNLAYMGRVPRINSTKEVSVITFSWAKIDRWINMSVKCECPDDESSYVQNRLKRNRLTEVIIYLKEKQQ